MVTKELTKMDLREMRGDLYFPVAKDSDYGVKILPPDFTFNELRGGETLDDIYRAVAAGIGGTAMPTWKNVLPESRSVGDGVLRPLAGRAARHARGRRDATPPAGSAALDAAPAARRGRATAATDSAPP